MACILLGTGQSMAAEQADLRLRIQWTRPTAVRTAGTIRVEEGRLSAIQNLSLDPGTTGSFWIESDLRCLRVAPPRAATLRGGVEVRYQGPATGDLTISLAPEGAEPGHEAIALPIADLIDQPATVAWGADGGRLWVGRRPGDDLRLDFGQSHLIFQAGTSLAVEATCDASLAKMVGADARFAIELRDARGGPVRWQGETFGSATGGSVPLAPIPLPEEEGAYDLTVSLFSADGPFLQLSQPDPITETTVQLVVLEDEPPSVQSPAPWHVVERVQPGEKKWWDSRWLPSSLPSLIGRSGEPAGSGPLGRVSVAGVELAQLAPGGWQAYPLAVERAGRPHRLVVRIPGGRPCRMGISILELDAAGRVTPLNLDSGVAVEPSVAGGEAPSVSHEIVFWPKTDRPYVVLVNHSSKEPAWFQDVTVEAGPERLPPAAPARAEPAPDGSGRGRLAALYLDKPLLIDAFGATRSLDAASGVALDDWISFLEAGERLVQYLKHAGYNGAILTVSGEGGALYPTDLLAATGRFDTGLFSSRGHDPYRKDVLELLFRLFDREGLRLVPAIEFATPLPELERLLAAEDGRATGILAGEATGEPADAEAGLPEPTPRDANYNPLDPRVQAAIERQLAELAQRYGDHPAWGGIGVHIGTPTYLAFRGMGGGRDARTLTRFATSLPGRPPEEASLASWASGGGLGAFLQWRGERLAEFYGRLARRSGPGALFLLTAGLRPASGSTDDLAIGLDWEAISRQKDVVPMGLLPFRPLAEPLARRQQFGIAGEDPWATRLAGHRSAGSLLFTAPEEVRLPALEQRNPWQATEVEAWLFPHGSAAGAGMRRRLAEGMAGADRRWLAIGGWAPLLGQEAQIRSWMQVYSRLPEAPFETVPADPQSAPSRVIVRQLRREEGRYLYAVNPEMWAVRLEVSFDPSVSAQPLGNSEAPDPPGPAGTWQPVLEPGELQAVFLPGSAQERLSWHASAVQQAALVERLGKRVEDFGRRMASLGNPPPYPHLVNGDFERPIAGDSIPGWLQAQHPSGYVSLETQHAAEGRQAMRLQGDAGGVHTWILSDPLPPPDTGRLAVSARIRAAPATAEPVQLRMAIEARYRGSPLRRSVIIGTPAAGPPPRTDWSASPYRLEVTDLPTSGLEELRIVFDMLSPGTVWIDQVQVSDLFLTERERSGLQSQMFLAVERMRRGDLTACSELLDSHWGRYLMQLPIKLETAAPPAAAPRPALSTAERIRNWLPGPLRF